MIPKNFRLPLALLLIGAAALLFAGPFGDWASHFFKKSEAASPAPSLQPAPLSVLQVKRNTLMPAETQEKSDTHPMSKPVSNATLTNSEIESVVRQREGQFQRCWTQRLRDVPNLSGNVLLQFEITPRGRVEDIKIAESTINDETMLRCLASVLERISFREFTGQTITLTFPLSFE